MHENLSLTQRMLMRVRIDADQRHEPAATATPATINGPMLTLVAELAANEIPAPLSQSFTLACMWADLCRLAGEPIPVDVALLVEGTPVA